MPKTIPPATLHVPGVGRVEANAAPDAFDARDLPYRPRLQPLPPVLDTRTLASRYVMKQKGSSCTGHAVATVVNTVLAQSRPDAAVHVSPYMLYALGRRYDDFPGEDDLGSSLRGVLKGWFNHGLAPEESCPRLDAPVKLEDAGFVGLCRACPLGAFYRVVPQRLDDVQSALCELHAVAVSAQIHRGWLEPRRVEHDGEDLWLIERGRGAEALGGHAFALVGYNDVGFLVQNSWGARWGKGGFATLPYEDWLDSAYDAWVVRPGVPQTPFGSGRTRTARVTGGALATGPAPDLERLSRHVVNLGNEGRLSGTGKFVSTPEQLDRILAWMSTYHAQWAAERPGEPLHLVLYAHGGLNSEADGLEIAQKQLDWWLNNRVFPVTFCWQTGPVETLEDQLTDMVRGQLPFGGLGADLREQFDRLVEHVARERLRWMWAQMKQNAAAASAPAPAAGGSLFIRKLRAHLDGHAEGEVRVHLVGHSAGSIFHAHLLEPLRQAGIPVESVCFLAPALRVDEFAARVLPALRDGRIAHFTTFAMTDEREREDTCGMGGVAVYHKSLLYLVSRALETPDPLGGEVRLLGMQKSFARPLRGKRSPSLAEELEQVGAHALFSPCADPADARTDSSSHGGFDDDADTMTSVLMRVLGTDDRGRVTRYAPHAASLRPPPVFPVAGIRGGAGWPEMAGAR